MTIEKIIAERRNQHGDFTDHAAYTQCLKNVVRSTERWCKLTPIQREAIEMILHKIGRILAGNPNHHDHWDDIAGYAKITSDRIPKET